MKKKKVTIELKKSILKYLGKTPIKEFQGLKTLDADNIIFAVTTGLIEIGTVTRPMWVSIRSALSNIPENPYYTMLSIGIVDDILEEMNKKEINVIITNNERGVVNADIEQEKL